jgi:pilus assembly protein CpaE
MKCKTLNVSVLFGTGSRDPAYREILSSLDNLKILQEGVDPNTFLTQHLGNLPDLVFVDLNGSIAIPDWLQQLIAQLPHTEVMVCSQSRDPDFLIRVLKLRAGGFIPLPLNREELLALMDRVRAEREQHLVRGRGQLLAVAGTKGGVGTTSVATNLAVALAEIPGQTTVLLDLARPFPQIGQFLDLKSAHTIKDIVANAENLDPVFLQKVVAKHKSNLEVIIGQVYNNPKAPALVDQRALGKVFASLRSLYSSIVVDLGVGMDALYVQTLQEADLIWIVTQLTVSDLQNLKIIKMLLRDWNIPDKKIKIVVNRYTKDYDLGLKDIERNVYQPVSHTLPNDYKNLIEAINQGIALGEVAPRSKLWRKLESLAAELAAARQEQDKTEAPTGLLRRLFS